MYSKTQGIVFKAMGVILRVNSDISLCRDPTLLNTRKRPINATERGLSIDRLGYLASVPK